MSLSTSTSGSISPIYQPYPDRRTHATHATLAAGRGSIGQSSGGTRGNRLSSPSTFPFSLTDGWNEEPNHHLGAHGAVELADTAQRRNAGERAPPFPWRVVQGRRAPEGTQRSLSRPAAPSPRDEPMPTEAPALPARTWLAGCIVHRDLPVGAPEMDVKINGKPFRAILDSGIVVSLVQSNILAPRMDCKRFLPITCVHGDTRQVPTRRVTISTTPGTWPVEVGVVKDLPVPMLIGRDWSSLARRSLPAPEGTAGDGGPRKDLVSTPFFWPRTAGEMVSAPHKILTFSMMYFNR